MPSQVIDKQVPPAGTGDATPARSRVRAGVRPGALLVAAVVVLVVGVVLGATRLVDDSAGSGSAAAAGHAHGVGAASHDHAAGPDATDPDATDPDATDPDAAAPAVDGCQPGTPTAGETAYVEHMLAHHRQAVELARVLRTAPGVGYRVQNLADHIAVVQRGEAQDMQAWLTAWRDADQPAACPGSGSGAGSGAAPGHGHAGSVDMATMPGMVAPAEVAALGRQTGVAAERRYLRLMIAHHEGAVTMSEPVVRTGANPWVLSLARHVVADQVSEIGAMRRALAGS